MFRIALANIRRAINPDESVLLAEQAIQDAAAQHAELICFPESFIPGYRGMGRVVPPPDAAFLERAWTRIAAPAAKGNIAVVLGTERLAEPSQMPVITALVIDRDGSVLGFQDKVQLDPSEDDTYSPGTRRRVFRTGPLTFGVVICHEGWRYPETVRWAVRHGAQVVFHPQLHEDATTSFHENAVVCRAAENTCFFATVNCAKPGAAITSAVASPDGTLLCRHPYGEAGLLIADLNLNEATGLLAMRYKPVEHSI